MLRDSSATSRDSMSKADKIQQYEEFITERLRPDLIRVQDQRTEVENELQQYTDLKSNLQMLKQRDLKELRTTVDIGSDVSMQAVVEDTSTVFIKTGLGFWAECNLSESDAFIERHEKNLKKKILLLSRDVANKRAHIQIVLQGLGELTNIADSQ